MTNKSEYNKTYYLNHPEIKKKARERERKKRAGVQVDRSAFLLPLVVLSSVLLLSEMAYFYESWIRAFVLEGFVLIFSVLTHPSFIRRVFYKCVAFGICALSVYGMSSRYLENGIKDFRTDQQTQASIADLEQTIQEKRNQRDQLLKQGWITAAKKTDQLIDDLRIRLDSLRTSFLKMKPMVLHSTIIQILCRVFLMLGNVLLVQRVSERFEISNFSLKFQKKSLKTNVVSIKRG